MSLRMKALSELLSGAEAYLAHAYDDLNVVYKNTFVATLPEPMGLGTMRRTRTDPKDGKDVWVAVDPSRLSPETLALHTRRQKKCADLDLDQLGPAESAAWPRTPESVDGMWRCCREAETEPPQLATPVPEPEPECPPSPVQFPSTPQHWPTSCFRRQLEEAARADAQRQLEDQRVEAARADIARQHAEFRAAGCQRQLEEQRAAELRAEQARRLEEQRQLEQVRQLELARALEAQRAAELRAAQVRRRAELELRAEAMRQQDLRGREEQSWPSQYGPVPPCFQRLAA